MEENNMDAMTPAPSPANLEETKQIQTATFEFKGQGFEYFKIWIVNILLTILTLGIYSAWATVRNRRYFYSNMYLDGNNFQYLAEPLQILKGRIIAIAALIGYYYVSVAYPTFGLLCALALIFAIPYFYNQSLSFNARMSAYKNIQFRFKASYGQAFMVLYIWPILGVLTLGILMPLSFLKMHQYVVRNSAFGTTNFSYEASHGDYAKLFLIMLGIGLTMGGLSWGMMLAIPALSGLGMALLVATYLAVFIFYMVQINNLYFRSTALNDHQFNANLDMLGLSKVIAINALLTVLTLGLYLPAAQVRMTKYIADHVSLDILGSLDHFTAAEQENISALGEQMGQVFDFGA